jgi:hypothetical protein
MSPRVDLGRERRRRRRGARGSALLFVLLVCLGSSLLMLAVAAALMSGGRAIADETAGRLRWQETERALGLLAQAAAQDWAAGPVALPANGQVSVSGELVKAAGGDGLQGLVTASLPGGNLRLGAEIERARDGFDLPDAAVVATQLLAPPGRDTAWIADVENVAAEETGTGPGDTSVEVVLLTPPLAPLWGQGCSLRLASQPWSMDPGSLARLDQAGQSGSPGLLVLKGSPGSHLALPHAAAGGSALEPLLVLATGSPVLDATSRGDLYAVIVADGGTVRLEGTRVHGAVFATGTVDLGQEGQVLFDRAIWRSATDRSCTRTRLLPGTRSEEMAP